MIEYNLPFLPPNKNVETLPILKQAAKAHRYLAELKGIAKTIPNEQILINTLALQEAKDSSEIENIVTTHDDLYKENIFVETKNPASKEVFHYAQSLKLGFEIVRREEMLLNKHIIAIQQEMEGNRAGFRTQAGTKLINSSGEIVYTPPQDTEQVLRLMSNLEKFINDNDFADYGNYGTKKEEKTPVKLYLNKEILSKKQQYIQGCDIIEGKDVAKVFGTTDLAQQKAIMEVIAAHLGTEMSYEFIQRGERYLWVNKRKIKEHTCEKCDNIVQDLTQYGKQRYCKSCLKKIHDQEDADEAEGKAVKRYISAPPPGVKIKM